MANFAYTPFKRDILGSINLETDDIRAILVMADSTADQEEDAQYVANVSTLDEMDGDNYVRKALQNQALSKDDGDDRGIFDAGNILYTNMSAGTREVKAIILYKHVTNDGDSPLIGYFDEDGFPFSPSANGQDVEVRWNSAGILHQN